MRKRKVAILIPANNEEHVIGKTLTASRQIVDASDIYVVDDGSTDDTASVVRKHGVNVISIPNGGKAHALNVGIREFQLPKRYTYIFLMDADSRPEKDFLTYALVHFRKDPKKNVVCVSGRVKGSRDNWLTKYRQWEYQVSYLIHKQAQEYMGSIVVTPGCASVYKSSLFLKHEFPGGTLTEDMDFTFYLHRAGLNAIVFERNAIVTTIDPRRLTDYVRQVTRWYTGFWQVVRKHDIPWGGQTLDLEVAILAVEGLYNGILVFFLLFSAVNLWFSGSVTILLIPFLFDFLLFFLPTLVWSAIVDRDPKRLLYIPHFYFLRFLSSVIFLACYFRGYFSKEQAYVWDSNRFTKKEVAR